VGRAGKLPWVWHETRLHTTLGSHKTACAVLLYSMKQTFQDPIQELERLYCFQSRNLACDGSLMLGNSAQDSTMLWIFSEHLHVRICIKAPPIWEEQESCNGTFSLAVQRGGSEEMASSSHDRLSIVQKALPISLWAMEVDLDSMSSDLRLPQGLHDQAHVLCISAYRAS